MCVMYQLAQTVGSDRCSVVMLKAVRSQIGGLAPTLVWNLQGKVNHLEVNLFQTWEQL